MKSLIVFLAIVAYAASTPQTRSISSLIVDAIEDIKAQMPCGFAELGIPSLAPLEVPHKALTLDEDFLRINGEVKHFRLNGLNDFEVVDMTVNPITSRVKFHLTFNNVNVDTSYDVVMFLKKLGFTLDVVGAGPAKFAVKGIQIRGMIKYNLGLISRKLKLKSLELRTHIGDVVSEIEGLLGEGLINRKLNDVLEKIVQFAVNGNEQLITNTIENMVLPRINAVLSQVTLSEIIGIVAGEGDTEKPICDPESGLLTMNS